MVLGQRRDKSHRNRPLKDTLRPGVSVGECRDNDPGHILDHRCRPFGSWDAMVLLIRSIRTCGDTSNSRRVGEPALGGEETRARGLLPAGKEACSGQGRVHWVLEAQLVSSWIPAV